MEAEAAQLTGMLAAEPTAHAQARLQALVAKSGKSAEEVQADVALLLQLQRVQSQQVFAVHEMLSALLGSIGTGGAGGTSSSAPDQSSLDAIQGSLAAVTRKMDATAQDIQLVGADVRHGLRYMTWSDVFSKRTLRAVLTSPLLMARKAVSVYMVPQCAFLGTASRPLLLALGALQTLIHVIWLVHGARYLMAEYPELAALSTTCVGYLGGVLVWLKDVYGSTLGSAGSEVYDFVLEQLLAFKAALHTHVLGPLVDGIVAGVKTYVADLPRAAARGALSAATFGYFGGGGGGSQGAATTATKQSAVAGTYDKDLLFLQRLSPMSLEDAVEAWVRGAR